MRSIHRHRRPATWPIACPIFPAKTSRLHWSFHDPSQATGTEDEQLDVFRRVRDQVKQRLIDWIKTQ